jgi:hypothetical protein
VIKNLPHPAPNSNARRFIVFTAPGCAACGPVKKLVERAADGLGIPVEIVDCTIDTKKAAKYHVLSTPTVLLLMGDRVARSRSGRMTAAELEKWLAETNGGSA